MKKIDGIDLRKLKDDLNFYDFDKLSPKRQDQLLVSFKDGVNPVTYSDLRLGGDRKEYEHKEKTLLLFLKGFIKTIEEPCCLISRYNERWLASEQIVPELSLLLEKLSITDSFCGLSIEKNNPLICLFFQSIFRYNSFVQFIFKDKQIIVSPSDHLDIFIASRELDSLMGGITKAIKEHERAGLAVTVIDPDGKIVSLGMR